jgi:beta-galactosidase
MWVYYSNADEVELFLNGKSLGIKSKQGDELHLVWKVSFEPGTIKAVSRKVGKVILEKEIRTAGNATQLVATADRSEISADGEDLSFITVDVVDENGIIVPDAKNQIQFEISGNARIVGVDNGDPTSHESLKGSTIKAFHGKCLVVVQAAKRKVKLF